MNIGDPIDTPHGKGNLVDIQGKVGVVEIEEAGQKRTIYIRLSEAETEV